MRPVMREITGSPAVSAVTESILPRRWIKGVYSATAHRCYQMTMLTMMGMTGGQKALAPLNTTRNNMAPASYKH